jgi:hypothetical protein
MKPIMKTALTELNDWVNEAIDRNTIGNAGRKPTYFIRTQTAKGTVALVNAGTAQHRKRKEDSFMGQPKKPLVEFDGWAVRM